MDDALDYSFLYKRSNYFLVEIRRQQCSTVSIKGSSELRLWHATDSHADYVILMESNDNFSNSVEICLFPVFHFSALLQVFKVSVLVV